MRVKVYFLIRLLPPLAGLTAIVILTLTTYLSRRQRYYIVSDERANRSVQHSIMKVLGADYMSRVVPACRVDSGKRVDYEIAITCTRPAGLSLLITI